MFLDITARTLWSKVKTALQWHVIKYTTIPFRCNRNSIWNTFAKHKNHA